jgi:DNA-binding NarL/FixJ family response regulator
MSAPYTWAPRSGPDMLRILIADDHDVVRSGLRSLIESQTDWEVVAEAADGKEAVSKAIETRPDVAVLDYSMPLINGAAATRQIRARLPRTEVLIFTIHDDEMLVRELLCAGARGYVLKSDSRLDLLSAIESVGEHKAVFTTSKYRFHVNLLGCLRDLQLIGDHLVRCALRHATKARPTKARRSHICW